MAQRIVTEEIVTDQPTIARPVRPSRTASLVYTLFGILEILLAIRFALLLLGASQASGFVNFIYALSAPFVAPFYGIFPNATYAGSYFDPATLVAIAVYAVISYIIVRLIVAVTGRPVIGD